MGPFKFKLTPILQIVLSFLHFGLLFSPGGPLLAVPDSLQIAAGADSLREPYDYTRVRGVEREGRRPINTVRKALNALLWPPRVVVDGVLRTASFSAVFIDEKRIIRKFEDFFYLFEDQVGWFPVLNVVSGSPRGVGASLFYQKDYFSSEIKSIYANNDIWGLKGEISYIFFSNRYFWQIDLEARLENDDDFRFFGIGPAPARDPRSRFLPGVNQERGEYAQRRILLLLNLGVRPAGDWEIFWTNWYQKRTIHDPAGDSPTHFSNVFDTANLPGSFFKSKKLYSEVSVRFDNRESVKIFGPGSRVEGYAGIAMGLKSDIDRLFRAGVDAMQFIPVLRQNRLLVPRLIVDMVQEVTGRREIAFPDYPRHLAFRGARSKKILRSDKLMLQPSLEYQWPLAFYLGGHLFFDYLMVAPTASKFTTRNAPWAAGLGIDFHSRLSEVARLLVSYGSEGLFFKVDVGLSSLNKDRSNWK